eukprot:9417355-Alexandrium_andersonii.AAC.1
MAALRARRCASARRASTVEPDAPPDSRHDGKCVPEPRTSAGRLPQHPQTGRGDASQPAHPWRLWQSGDAGPPKEFP